MTTHACRYGSALLLCTAQKTMLLLESLLATQAIPVLQRLQTPTYNDYIRHGLGIITTHTV